MGLRDLLSPSRKHRQARSKNSGNADPAEGKADPAASGLDSASTLVGFSTPVPQTPREGEPDSTRTPSFQAVHLIILTPNPGGNATPKRVRSVFGKKQSERPSLSIYTIDPSAAYEKKTSWKSTAFSATKLAINIVKDSSDVFPPLKSVVGSLSAILKICDVCSISLVTPTRDVHTYPSKRWRVVKR